MLMTTNPTRPRPLPAAPPTHRCAASALRPPSWGRAARQTLAGLAAASLWLLLGTPAVWAGSPVPQQPAAQAAPLATPSTTPSATSAATPAGAAKPAGAQLSKDIARIMARGELVVAMLGVDSPPFFYERDGKLQGIDVAMAQEIGVALGVPVRIDRSPRSFNAVVEMVSRGEADLGISKISRTLARAKSVQFSDPYVTLRHSLLLNRLEFAKLARERTPLATVQDFKGSLGVIAKSSFLDFAAINFPDAKVRQYPGWDEVVAAVRAGEVVAGYRDEFEVKRVLAEAPSLSLSLRSITLKDKQDAIGIAMGAEATALRSFVNLFLATRKTRLEIDDVLKALPSADKGSKT